MSGTRKRHARARSRPGGPPEREGGAASARVPAAAIAVGLAVLVLAVYWPVREYGFINFDDPLYVSQNAEVLGGLTWTSAAWAFTATHAGNWHPVTWLSHMLDAQIYGAEPGGHHVTNLVLHVANTLCLFAFLFRTTGSRWRSALVSALFGIHPLHVESVAWIAERKDVLSTLFLFATLLAYSVYTRRPTWTWFLIVTVLFALGLMSKPMLVTLPVLLLLLDLWPLGRLEAPSALWPRLVEKAPLFALSFAVSLVTLVVQRQAGAVAALESLPLGRRLANAVVACGWYLAKTVWPSGLAAIYPYRASLPWWEVAAAATTMAGISLVVVRERRRAPYLLIGWLWFLLTLVPVIGLVQVGGQPWADRYTYVPAIGLFLMAAWGLADIARRWPRAQVSVAAAAVVVLTALTVAARAQIGHWASSLALWTHATSVTAGNYRALANLGQALWLDRRVDEAIDQFRASLQIKPDFAEARNYLGTALADQGDPASAAGEYRAAIAVLPGFVEAHNNLGLALAAQKDFAGAIASFSEAVRLDPSNPAARTNLGIAYAQSGRFDDAIQAFTAALALDPGSGQIRLNLAIAYRDRGEALIADRRLDAGVASLRQAVALAPAEAAVHYSLGTALALTGASAEAIRELQQALQLDPHHAEAKAALTRLTAR